MSEALEACRRCTRPSAELYRRNGLQFLPFNTLYQYRVDERTPEADAALLVPDLIAFVLTGRRVAERTNASTTGLLDVRTSEYDLELAERLGTRHPCCRRWSTRERRSAVFGPRWRGASAPLCWWSRSARTTRRPPSPPHR